MSIKEEFRKKRSVGALSRVRGVSTSLRLCLSVNCFRRLLPFFLIGCVTHMPALGQQAPRSAEVPWEPKHMMFGNEPNRDYRHEALLQADTVYTLGQLIDIAELNNPSTHAAWERARVAAASVGIAKSELYPTVLAAASGRTYRNAPLLYQSFVLQDLGLLDTTLTLNYTLIDFGTRRAEITAAQARLLAANLSFNNEHLVLIQQVSLAYYNLLNATGLRQAR